MGLEDIMRRAAQQDARLRSNPFGDDPYMDNNIPGQPNIDLARILELPDDRHLLTTKLAVSKREELPKNPLQYAAKIPQFYDPRMGGSLLSPASHVGAVGTFFDIPRYGVQWAGYKMGKVPSWSVEQEDFAHTAAEALWRKNPGMGSNLDPIPEGIVPGAGWFAKSLFTNPKEVAGTVGAMVAGGLMDMATDPLTYYTAGAGPLLKQVAKYLNSDVPIRVASGLDEIPPVGNAKVFGEITPDRIPTAADEYIRRHIVEEVNRMSPDAIVAERVPSQVTPTTQVAIQNNLDNLNRLNEVTAVFADPVRKQQYEALKETIRGESLDRLGQFTRDDRGFEVFTPENRRRIYEAPDADARLRAVAEMSVALERKLHEDLPGSRIHVGGEAFKIPGISGKPWDPGIPLQTLFNAPRRLMEAMPHTSRIGKYVVPAELADTKVADLANLDQVKGVPITPELKQKAQAAVQAMVRMTPNAPVDHIKLGDIEPHLIAEGPIPGEAAREYGIGRPMGVTSNPTGGWQKAEFKNWLTEVAQRESTGSVSLGHEAVYASFRPIYDFLYEFSKLTPRGGVVGNTSKELEETIKVLDEWVIEERAKPRPAGWQSVAPAQAWDPEFLYHRQLSKEIKMLAPAAHAEIEAIAQQVKSPDPATQAAGAFAAKNLVSGHKPGGGLQYMPALAEKVNELLRLRPPSWTRMDKAAQQMQILQELKDTYKLYSELMDLSTKYVTQPSFFGMIHALIRADGKELMKMISPPQGVRYGWTPGIRQAYVTAHTNSTDTLASILSEASIQDVGGTLRAGLYPGINKVQSGVYQFRSGLDLSPFEAWEIRIAADYANGDLENVLKAIWPRLSKLGVTFQVAAPHMLQGRIADANHGHHAITIFTRSAEDLVHTAREMDEILTDMNLANPGTFNLPSAAALPTGTSGRVAYKFGSPYGNLVAGPPPARGAGHGRPVQPMPPQGWLWSDGTTRHYPEWTADPFASTFPQPKMREIVELELQPIIQQLSEGILDQADSLALAKSLAALTLPELERLKKNMGNYWHAVLDVAGREFIAEEFNRALTLGTQQWESHARKVLMDHSAPLLEDITRMRELHMTNPSSHLLPVIYKKATAGLKGLAKHFLRNLGMDADMIDKMEVFQFSKQTGRFHAYNKVRHEFIWGDPANTGFDGLNGILRRFGKEIPESAFHPGYYDRWRLSALDEGVTRIDQIPIDLTNGIPTDRLGLFMYEQHMKGREMVASALGIPVTDTRIDAIVAEVRGYTQKVMDDLYRKELARNLNVVYRQDYLPIILNGTMADRSALFEHMHGGPEAVRAMMEGKSRAVSSFFAHSLPRKFKNVGQIWRYIEALNSDALRSVRLDITPELSMSTILAKRLESHHLAMSALEFLDDLKWAHPDKVIPVKYTKYADELGEARDIGRMMNSNVPQGVPFLGMMGEIAASDYVRAELVLPEMRGWILRSDIAQYFKSFDPYQGIFSEGDWAHVVWSKVFWINQSIKRWSIMWDFIMLKNQLMLALVGDIDVGKAFKNLIKYKGDIQQHPYYEDMIRYGLFPAGNLEVGTPIKDLIHGELQRVDTQSWLERNAPASAKGVFQKLHEKTRMGAWANMRNFLTFKQELYPIRVLTWDISDKFLRATLYEQAMDKGMTRLDAARAASNIMIDYQMRWQGELAKKIGYSLFPFYAWMMGNAYQHIPAMYTHPRLYAVLGRAENMVNRYAVGDDTEDNPAMLKAAMLTPFYKDGEQLAVVTSKPWGSFERLKLKLWEAWAKQYPDLPVPREWTMKLNATAMILAQFFTRRIHQNFFNLGRMGFYGQRDMTKMENEAYTKDELEAMEDISAEVLWGLAGPIGKLNEEFPLYNNLLANVVLPAAHSMGVAQGITRENDPNYDFPWEALANFFITTRRLTPSGNVIE